LDWIGLIEQVTHCTVGHSLLYVFVVVYRTEYVVVVHGRLAAFQFILPYTVVHFVRMVNIQTMEYIIAWTFVVLS
jgi:hypothetical protein